MYLRYQIIVYVKNKLSLHSFLTEFTFMRSLFTYLIVLSVLISLQGCDGCSNDKPKTGQQEEYVSNAPVFNADSAFNFIKAQCDFGPRTMNSEAHEKCGDYLVATFKQYGANVYEQTADLKLYDGTPIKCRNIIAAFNEQAPRRIMICSHWDSRPWADHDEDEANHKTAIDGANDGASGVAVLLELARQFSIKMPSVGVDLVCFDAEDCGTPEWARDDTDSEHTWCLGSQYWAGKHHIDGYVAEYGILLDMVGGPNSVFLKEGFSIRMAPAVTDKVWAAGQRIGYGNYFVSDVSGYVTDDHVQVNQCGIPCTDVIASDKNDNGFCSTWHTTADNIKNIDQGVLKAVGQTMMEVIYVTEGQQ